MIASADNIVDLTVAITVEIGINANKQTTHDSLTLQYHAARCPWVSGYVERGNAKKASQPCHFDLNWFLERRLRRY